MKSSLALTATALLALGLLAGCGDEDDPPPREAASPLPAPTTSAPEPPTTVTRSPSATPTTSPTAAPTFPPAVTDPVHGGSYVAVYLAVTRGGVSDAQAKAAEAAAEKVGYDPATSDIDCDQGARAGLDLDRTTAYLGTSLYFADRAQAKQFVDAYEPGVVGTVAIKAFCLD